MKYHKEWCVKKIIISFLSAAVLSSTVSADFLKVEGGVGMWQQQPSGDASYTENGYNGKYTSDENTVSKGYAWLMIKHPVPIIPNLRVEYVAIEDEGSVQGRFKEYDAGTFANAKYKLNQYDIIPYYNILDNLAWITLDVGLDIKIIDSDYEANDVIDNDTALRTDYSDSYTATIPLLYVRTRFEILFDIAAEADVKYISYDDKSLLDARAKLDYTLDFVPVIQPAIEVGYRYQNYNIDDEGSNDAKVDLTFSGFYAGVMLRY